MSDCTQCLCTERTLHSQCPIHGYKSFPGGSDIGLKVANILNGPLESPPPVKSLITETVAERTSQYGDFRDQGMIAQALKETARMGSSWGQMVGFQREAIDMILHKIARIVCGNPDYADSWHDIQGYAKITEDRLPGCPTGNPHCAAQDDHGMIHPTTR